MSDNLCLSAIFYPFVLSFIKPTLTSAGIYAKYGFDTVFCALYNLMCLHLGSVNRASYSCLAHLCSVWNGSVSLKLRAAHIWLYTTTLCHCCFTVGIIGQRSRPRTSNTCCLSVSLRDLPQSITCLDADGVCQNALHDQRQLSWNTRLV